MLLFFSFFVLLFRVDSKALEALKGNKHLFANVCGTHERSYKNPQTVRIKVTLTFA